MQSSRKMRPVSVVLCSTLHRFNCILAKPQGSGELDSIGHEFMVRVEMSQFCQMSAMMQNKARCLQGRGYKNQASCLKIISAFAASGEDEIDILCHFPPAELFCARVLIYKGDRVVNAIEKKKWNITHGSPRNKRPAFGQDTEAGVRLEHRPEAFIGFPTAEAKQGRVKRLGLASLNNFRGLWAMGWSLAV